ncbi:ABC transporter substrate-binding protein [Hyphomicrobium sp.]|uniref:ABC transporter substrate-binding protein n=1 Tax=Hyphomicrobium sp. TaxID=82 RepID=UPI0025C5F787|nr:ABC transporter substrate-binding protein [Hyphomicrobium sp.]MCC7250636.1 ABC transporter substrate-binding protein [Hyphomicrobium sp.]
MTRWFTVACFAFVAVVTMGASSARADESVVITDIVGRKVTIERPVKRILLGEGRQLLALSLIHPDPVSLLAGWPADLVRQDATTYGRYRERFPGIEKVSLVGQGSVDTFSIEQALAVQPDVAVFSGGYGPSVKSTDVVSRLENAGVRVLFIDFIAKPLDNTAPSLAILGQLLGREPEAQAYIDFYNGRRKRIADRLAEAKPKAPNVFMHAHAGLGACCNSPARATIGAFIDAAGGHNIAADVLKTPFGQLNLEYILSKDPDIYVGTGGVHLAGKGGLVMGPGIDEQVSRTALAEVVARPGLADLAAVRNGRVYGLWHIFNNNPANFLAVEVLAKWFHPELFADIDPDASLRELNERFLPVPMQGTYWIRLNSPGEAPHAGSP